MMFPEASCVNIPVAATAPIAGMDPVVLKPHFPELLSFVQAAWTPEVTTNIESIMNIKSFVGFIRVSPLETGLNLHSALAILSTAEQMVLCHRPFAASTPRVSLVTLQQVSERCPDSVEAGYAAEKIGVKLSPLKGLASDGE